MEIRNAIAADYDAYVRLVRELRVDDPIASRDRFANELITRMIVATDGDVVVGYLLLEHIAGVGYVRNVVSDPNRRRTGIGVALMQAARDRFTSASAASWCLNVRTDNVQAIGLYERFGMTEAFRTHILRVPRSVELPAPDPTLAVAPLPATADAHVEPRLKLLSGQLASARKKMLRQVLALSRGDDVLGIGVFLTTVPGAFPFRLVAPEYAAAFVAHLRTYVPDAHFVQVGAEDDDALVAELVRLGAVVHLELLHMTGPLG